MTKQKLFIFALIFTGIAWLAGFVLFHHRINHFAPDDGQPADAIVVLTGGKNRIAEAVKLLNNGLGEKLFISGVSKGISLNDLSQRTDITIRTQREITLDDRSTNTIENAIEAAEWIEKNNISSIRLVTSNYHLLRSEQEFRARAPGLKIILHPVYSENVSTRWWRNLGSFTLVASEYIKFLIVWLRSRTELLF